MSRTFGCELDWCVKEIKYTQENIQHIKINKCKEQCAVHTGQRIEEDITLHTLEMETETEPIYSFPNAKLY